jgi:hypothetical protein
MAGPSGLPLATPAPLILVVGPQVAALAGAGLKARINASATNAEKARARVMG